MITQTALDSAMSRYRDLTVGYRQFVDDTIALQITAERFFKVRITRDVAREVVLFQQKMHPNHVTAYKIPSFVDSLLSEFIEYYSL